MKKSTWSQRCGVVLLGLGLWGYGGLYIFSDEEKKYVPDEILVRYNSGVSSAEIRQLRRLINAERLEKFSINNVHHYKLDSNTSVEEAIAELEKSSKIRYAEPNYLLSIDTTPNDPDYSKLYGMNNTGQTGGKVDADIDAPEAWSTQTGNPNLVIAVIDTGIDYNHPDLAANIWTNPSETPGNGKDDDGNGYVDDIHGYDFYNKDGDPMDDHYHGTHVAGTIAGVGNNSTGVVGVVWKAKLMALKFLSSSGSGSTSNAVLAIQYATKMGAKISNNSWGGGGFSQSLKDAITANGNAGALFIAAAGNSGANADSSPMYPAAYDNPSIVSVAATNYNDALASFSNYGLTTVDLAAPGVNIYSTAPNNQYKTLSGTSMATPHVAGGVALIWSQLPNLTNSQIKDKLLLSVDPIASLSGKTVTGGRLNVYNFMDNDTTPPSPVTNLAVQTQSYFTETLTWIATGDDGSTGKASSYDLRYSTSTINDSNWSSLTKVTGLPTPKDSGQTEVYKVDGLSANTKYYFALKVIDNMGNTSTLSNVASGTTTNGTVFYKENFENGQNNWVTSGTDGNGGGTLWHLSNRKSMSPTTAFYYGIESSGTYNTGQSNYGSSTSPKIYLTSATSSMLIFSQYLTTENLPPYDEASVRVSKDGGVTWKTHAKYYSTGGKWSQVALDLSQYDGKAIQVQFYFNTLDALYNGYEGWYVDDVQIMAEGSADTTPPAAVTNLAVGELEQYAVTLGWTATGDDGNTGTAALYDIRYSTSSINDSNFSSASQVSGEPVPKPVGSSESFEVAGLSAGTTYYFAMKVIDDLGNTSSLSNVVSGKTKTGPKMNVTPSSIPKMSLNTGQTGSQTLTIQNTGDENLTYDISEVPSASAIGTESIEPDALTNSSEKAAYAPSQILVKFKEGVSEISIRDLAEQMDAHTIRVYPEIGARLIETVAQIDPMELARMYLASGLVDYAEPDYIVQTMAIPNDPSFSSLYGLNNTGQTGGTVDADIDAPEAWDITKGSTSVVVAVIDTGVDYSHQDLSTNIWTNPGEIANNGKDDDGNGYVDDIRGWDFVNKDNDPMDDNKHGTHVSGTIGGVGNNGVGVAGVSWTVKIMPLKFLSGSGSGYTSDAVSAVIYAAKNGAKIMSNSWGGGGYSQALYDAIKLADSKGCLFVAAAGNSSSNNDQVPNYPSNYNVQNVIAVAATDHNDNLASFSSYGVKTVHLGAPGVSIYSTLPNNSYGSLSGTSMATPHVAGACALVWGGNQSWNYLKVKNQILANVDKISSLSDKVISGGRLNVYKAFQGLETIPPADVTNLSSEMVSYSTIKLKWTATGDDGGSGTATSYEIRYSTSVINSSNFSSATLVKGVPAPKPSGSLEELNITSLTQKTKYYFALKAIDDVGNISGLSNVPSATTDEASVVYKDDMESAAGWTATGLWHQSTRKNSSPTHSFYYGSETKGNYDTGAKNSGTLTSSPIDLTSGVSPGLSFQFWRSVENYAYGSYDKTYLEISKDSGKTWNLLWYKDSKNASEQAWTSSGQLDLTSYKGYKVLLRFTFNTVDAYLNFYEGLYVDDLQILDAKTNYAWLAAQPTSGTVAPNQSSTVTLQYDATNLSGGTYKGAINIKSNDPQKSSVTLNAELEVSQDTSAPSAISDLRVTSLPNATSMNLSWTAPGDDGMTGKATSYEIRYSTSMITESNFSQGTLVSSPPTPQTAGSTETFTLSGINLLQSTYYVAIKTKDDVGNVALISNVILSSSLDSDADGLSDQDELALGTNPFNPDSDSDGYTDGQEKSIGTDPLSGTDYPAKILISGDDAYQLYANGTLIGTGSKWYIPGTHLCKLGDSIAIKVNNYGWIGGLIFQVQHGSKIKPSNFLVKVSKTAASDWKEINFDDTSWQSASEHYPYGKGPWGSVVNGFDSSAYWIGLENPFESTFYVRFKVDFTLNAKINITADNVFEAWMDGQSLGSGDSWWLPKTYIATVKTGTLFAIHGINQGGPGGLSALITYIDDNGKRRSIGTDSSWKGSLFQETNWEKKSFDDGHWAPSLELYGLGSGPWGYSGMLNQMSSTDAAHSWIWGSLDTEKNIHFYTRKTIPELPNATIYVTADNQFSLYQNGKLIGGSSEWWKTKSFGLNVNKGDVIAFKVDNFGGPGGLIASMDYNGKTIVSNTTWVVTTESMSGNNNSWTSQNYDTSSWLNASSLGENGSSPWGIRPGIDASAEWVGPSDFESNPVAYFRFKVGDANAPVGQCKIQSACDDECKMYLNGKLIASGNKWYQPQNTSISASSGDILAVEAKDHGYKAGMLFKMTGTYSLNSDTTWKCSTNAPSDWKEKDFNDTSWENATSWGVYGAAPWGQNVSGFSGGSSYWIWSKNNQTASFNIDATVYFRKKIE